MQIHAGDLKSWLSPFVCVMQVFCCWTCQIQRTSSRPWTSLLWMKSAGPFICSARLSDTTNTIHMPLVMKCWPQRFLTLRSCNMATV